MISIDLDFCLVTWPVDPNVTHVHVYSSWTLEQTVESHGLLRHCGGDRKHFDDQVS